MTLEEYLEQSGVDEGVCEIVLSLSDCVMEISGELLVAEDTKVETVNPSGEQQMKLDVKSNDIVLDILSENEYVGIFASEEIEDERVLGDGEFGVACDPLDGSSLLDVNLSVGSIFGVYKTPSFLGTKGENQVAAVLGVYGPRVGLFVTVGKGTHYFVLNEEADFVLHKGDIRVEEGKMFAPGNLRACKSREDYAGLVNYWIKEQYVLRYSGGMVPDVGQILLKNKGIFSYPGYDEAPDGKLRLLYECAPMAFIMEQAGGAASDGSMRILEKELHEFAQRTPIYLGSKGEVQRCVDTLA